jgi:tetratricopeptide (TPR) repeat protein
VNFFRPTGDKRRISSLRKVQALFQKAFPYMRSKQYDKARALFLQALKFRDDIEDLATIEYLLISLGATWLFEGLYEEEITFWTKYLSRYSADGPAYCSRAGAFWYSGKLDEALDDYSRALKLQPLDILSLSGRGQILAEIGQNDRALADLDLALRLLKEIPALDHDWIKWYEQIEAYVRNGRGFALAGLGDNESALSEFEVSIKLGPENAWVYYNRGRVYERTGEPAKAYSDYQIALSKCEPELSATQREYARARLRDLSN